MKPLDTLKRKVATLAVRCFNTEATIRLSDGRTITMRPEPIPSDAEIAAHVAMFTDLPADKGMPTFGVWMDAHGIDPNRRYREAFRRLAILAGMRAAHVPAVKPHWPSALAALEPHEKARDFIAEWAEISENLNHYAADASERRMRDSLARWFAANGADAEAAELDCQHDELLRLAGSLRKVVDGLEAAERRADHLGES